MNEQGDIIIYQSEDGVVRLDVRLEDKTVWLTIDKMAELFDKDRTVIGRHIRNIYKEEELEQNITCAKFAHMGSEGDQRYEYTAYNLDVIISVGYRVNSKRGVKFRQWANRVLKEYLIKGYAVNDRIRKEQIGELRQLVGMIGRTIQNKPLLSNDETNALFEVVTNYTYALDTLDNYDYERLTIDKTTKEEPSMLPTRMRWRLSMACARNSEVQHFLAMRKTTLSRAVSVRYTRPLEARSSIPAWRRKPPCCSTSSPRIIPSVMATNALPQPSSFGSSTIIISSIAKMAPSDWQTIHLLLSP